MIEVNGINIGEKFNSFSEYWTPKIVGELNGQFVKLAKLKGEFVWHNHKEEDELFYVHKGKLQIKLKDKIVNLDQGEFFIVPKGVDHSPYAENECHVILFEPKETAHTGNIKHELTVKNQEWI
ncbi:MAG: cupin domain-containing protein [Melioribacteraceae bacterium]|nr:cupin domain-containing protein [Melioribacteraceae bacterium]